MFCRMLALSENLFNQMSDKRKKKQDLKKKFQSKIKSVGNTNPVIIDHNVQCEIGVLSAIYTLFKTLARVFFKLYVCRTEISSCILAKRFYFSNLKGHISHCYGKEALTLYYAIVGHKIFDSFYLMVIFQCICHMHTLVLYLRFLERKKKESTKGSTYKFVIRIRKICTSKFMC